LHEPLSKTKLARAKILWIVATIALIPHTIILLLDHNYYVDDTPSYLIPADNLLHGQGFVDGLHHPEISRTPGYPLLLALFEIPPLKLKYLILLQHGLCIFMAVAVAHLALEIAESIFDRVDRCVSSNSGRSDFLVGK
jgi:hypothetical protein